MKSIIFLLENKNETQVLIVLRYYKSLNTTQIAKILDRSKSNAHAYIQNLLTNGFVEIVPKDKLPEFVRIKKGPKKFYQLSSQGQKIFDPLLSDMIRYSSVDAIEQQINFNDEEFVMDLAQKLSQNPEGEMNILPVFRGYFFSEINERLELISYQDYAKRIQDLGMEIMKVLPNLINKETSSEAIAEIMSMVNESPSVMINELLHIPIHSLADAKELGKIIIKFIKEVQDFASKNKSDSKQVRGIQHLYLFSGYLSDSLNI